jgi:hypothetical protein
MFLSKESQQSARVMGHVLNFPLYDGNCSATARTMLARGDVDGAIAEWHRLADLGSGRARCVLAFVALNGTPSTEPDLDAARQLASSALTGDKGYANYLLACIALKENQGAAVVAQYLGESYKSGFLPGAALLASLTIGSRDSSKKSRDLARNILRKAASAGYRPARLALCGWYVRGRFGLAHRVLGLAMMPIAIFRVAWAAKFHGFSLASFRYFIHPRVPLFADASRLALAKESSSQPRYLNVTRVIHIAAGTLAVIVAVSESADHSYSAIAGWITLAVWPYVVSYFVASRVVARTLSALVVESFLLTLVTVFVCDAYLGRTFESRLSTWMCAGIGVLEAIALIFASGFGALAAKRVVRTIEPMRHRQLVLAAHIVLGSLAALAVLLRPALWHVGYLAQHGFEVATQALVALLPYGAAAFFALPLYTANRWKPKAYLGILSVGTVLAVTSNSGMIDVQQGVVLMAQFIGFILAAEWALDGNEW